MLILRDVPNPRNADFWDHKRREGDHSMNFILWKCWPQVDPRESWSNGTRRL
jgi:hypothetical protein